MRGEDIMDFKNCEAFVIPFRVKEASAWKNVIQYLSKKETTPVEAICNSHVVSVDKEYYPIGRLEIVYTAKWNAISVFKEYWTEQETHYEKEIHYFDRWGNEHKQSGFDYYDSKSGKWKSGSWHPFKSNIKGYSGDASTRPWEPMEVTVTVTEDIPCERETGRKKNAGSINGNYIYQHSEGFPFFHSLFSDVKADMKIPYSEEAIQDGKKMEQVHPFSESDYNFVFSKAKSEAQDRCIKQIPGQAYANFRMEFDSNEVRQMWYYPVYHIIYEFQEQKYECFVSGCQEGYAYGKQEPEDASIENIKQEYDNKCSALNDKKKKYWYKFVWIFLGKMLVGGLLSIIMSIIGGTGSVIDKSSVLAIWCVAIYLYWKNYRDIKNTKKEIEKVVEANNNIVPLRQKKKNALLDVVLNDNLTDGEKAKKFEEILNS